MTTYDTVTPKTVLQWDFDNVVGSPTAGYVQVEVTLADDGTLKFYSSPGSGGGGGGELTDGDKGDIVVSSSGAVWTFDSSVVTSAARNLLDDADAAAMRTTLGLAIGTNVQAYDALLAAVAALTTSANQIIYATGSDTVATTTLDAWARSNLLTAASAAAARTALALGSLATLATVGTSQVDDNAVTNAKLRDSAALSVVGRSANSTGDPADIAAGTDGHVLRRSGTTLDFGTVATAGIADDAATNAKLANMAQATVKGRASGAGTGDPTDLSASQVAAILSGQFAAPSHAHTGDDVSLDDSGWTYLATQDSAQRLGNAVEDLYAEVRGRTVPLVLWTAVAQNFSNLAEAESLFAHAATKRMDLTRFTEVRLHVTQNAAASTNTKVRVKYTASGNTPTTLGNYLPLGASSTEVQVSATTSGGVNMHTSSWFTITASAIADVWLTVTLQGGDGAADPTFSSVVAEFR